MNQPSLSPAAASSPSTSNPNIWWVFAGLAALAALLFVRNPYVVLRPQFWHEDAIIFFLQQRTDGLAAIFHPYSGYLLLFPRVVAAIATILPLEFTPGVYMIGAYAGWLWVGGLILTSHLFSSVRWAFVASLSWVAVPHGGEVFLILTNTQWALAVGLALLLSEDPGGRSRLSQSLFVAIAAFTGPFCIFLAPLALWRLWRTKRIQREIDLIALLTLSAATIQFLNLVFSSNRMHESASIDLQRLSLLLWIGIFPELFGTKGALFSDMPLRLAGTIAGMIGMAWTTWVAIPGATDRRQLLSGAGLILGSGLLYVVATQGGAPMAFGGGQRYLFVPFALYVLALIAAWSHCQKEERTPLCAIVLLLVIGYHSTQHFVATKYRVADWPAACRFLRAGQAVEIQLSPLDTHVIIPPDRSVTASPPNP